MGSYFVCWLRSVQGHFHKAFDRSVSLRSRITNFALGIIKGIPFVGFPYVCAQQIVGSLRARIVSRPSFVSDIAKAEKASILPQSFRLERVAEGLKAQRPPPPPNSTVHGSIPEKPLADKTQECVVTFSKGASVENLGYPFSPVRLGVLERYSEAPKPDLKNIIVTSGGGAGGGDVVALVNLANAMHALYPQAKISAYLQSEVPVKQYQHLFSRLHPSIKYENLYALYKKDQELEIPDLIVNFHPSRHHLKDKDFEKLFGDIEIPRVDIGEAGTPLACDQGREFLMGLTRDLGEESSGLYQFLTRGDRVFRPNIDLGFSPGSGILLDPQRVHAPLSQGYYCHSYLADIQNSALKSLLMAAFLDPEDFDQEVPPPSINFGYSQHLPMRKLFLDVVSRDEKEKNVVLVCNDKSLEGGALSEQLEEVFSEEKLNELKELGYSHLDVICCGKDGFSVKERKELGTEKGRSFTLILFSSLDSKDVRCLQLASERLLATGDASSFESYASGCKLFLYETLIHKETWRQEQENYAGTISPELEGFFRAVDDGGESLTEDLVRRLQNPQLAEDFKFMCNKVSAEKNFQPVLDAAVRQAVWTKLFPELIDIEREALGGEFMQALKNYIGDTADNIANTEQKVSVKFDALEEALQKFFADK